MGRFFWQHWRAFKEFVNIGFRVCMFFIVIAGIVMRRFFIMMGTSMRFRAMTV